MAGCCGGDDEFVRLAGEATRSSGFEANTLLQLLRKPVQTCPDPFVGDPNVHGLNAQNFSRFLASNHAVLVLFYEKWDGGIVATKRDLAEVSHARKHLGEAYAAVDCAKDKAFCMSQGIIKTPVLAVFVNGRKVLCNIRPDGLGTRGMEQLFSDAQYR